MLSYFKVYVWFLFPPAAVLLFLLLVPLPHGARRGVVALSDAVLFSRPHPHLALSLFWLVFLLSLTTFVLVVDEMRQVSAQYREARGEVRTTELKIKLLAEERNAWISACCMTLWLVVHRFRNLLKKYYQTVDENERLMAELTVVKASLNHGPAPAVVIAQPSSSSSSSRATPLETNAGEAPKDSQQKKNE